MERAIAFIKKHRFDIIVTGSVLAFLIDIYFKKHTLSLTIIAFYVFGYAADNEREKTNIAERKRLLVTKGLTPEDLKNIAFVKDWEETRKKGLVKFSLIYGGVFFGFAMCGIISIGCALVKNNLLTYLAADPSNMVSFIGYTYVAGIISGTVIYRLLWTYNEQKFIRLTDPFALNQS
ncbi:MAG: hypothetical protein M3O71_02320 [Bacteroidota bacterium]|nr:hypothetical protein [Bacteroidota bacterium]